MTPRSTVVPSSWGKRLIGVGDEDEDEDEKV